MWEWKRSVMTPNPPRKASSSSAYGSEVGGGWTQGGCRLRPMGSDKSLQLCFFRPPLLRQAPCSLNKWCKTFLCFSFFQNSRYQMQNVIVDANPEKYLHKEAEAHGYKTAVLFLHHNAEHGRNQKTSHMQHLSYSNVYFISKTSPLMQQHFWLFFCFFSHNGLPHLSPSHMRGHEPGGLCFVLPIEARPPLSQHDPEVNWTHLAWPQPIQMWSFTQDKNISQELVSLQARGWEDTDNGHSDSESKSILNWGFLCMFFFFISQCS